jgi:lauroyl/myristoyl acyltransferase
MRPGDASRAYTRLVAPSDCYVLAVMGAMALVARARSPWLRDRVARAIAALAYRLSGRKRRGTEAMLARVFGRRLTPRRTRLIVRRAFLEFWRDTFSLLPLGAPERAVDVAGEEHLARALAGGRGAILWVSNHWFGMTTLKRALHARGFRVHKVHAEHHLGGFPGGEGTWVQQRLITPFFDEHERAIVAGLVTIRSGSLAVGRELARCLRANEIVCTAADGRVGQRFVFHRFLGVDEASPTGVLSLAKTSGAPLLPAFCVPGRRVRVVIEPPIAGDGADAVARWAAPLERLVRRHPSHYLNWHLLGTRLPSSATAGE